MFEFWLSVFAVAILTLYTGQTLLFAAGIVRGRKKQSPECRDEPRISIIVAARNEEAHLPHLLESLQHLDYPHSKTEILIVDDFSEDRTLQIARHFAQNNRRCRVLQADKSIESLNGKARALETAIAQASGEWLFVTDADCRVPPGWVRAHLQFGRASAGMVGGFVSPAAAGTKHRLFGHLQSLDWLYLCAVGAGAAGLGKALSIFGNNFSFRKSAYQQVGGFRGAGFSVIEDFALMRAMQKAQWEIALPANTALLVETQPASSLTEFYHQRKRWLLGGRGISRTGLYVLILSFLGRIAPLLALFAANGAQFLLYFGWFALVDLVLAAFAAMRVQRVALLRAAPLYPLFSIAYTIGFAPLFFLAKTVEWKGRRYSV